MQLRFFFACVFMTNYCLAQNTFPTIGNAGIFTTSPQGKLQIATLATDTVSSIRIGRAGDPGRTDVPIGGVTGGYNIDFHTWRDVAPNLIGARIRAERINTYHVNEALIQGVDLVFSTSSSVSQTSLLERLRIVNNGNIGIGLAAPVAKLQVEAPQGTTLAKYTQTGISAADAGLTLTNGTSASGTFISNIIGRSNSIGRPFGLYMIGESDDAIPIVADAGYAAVILDGRNKTGKKLLNNNVLAINNYSQNLILVKADGTVGICTTDTKGYKLAVNGSGIFTRLKVKEYNAWPDYVLHENYDLPTLLSLEKFITENNHLPEIPSEEEVKAEGMDVGEMTRLLLKKVEELTLYVIGLKKEIELLKSAKELLNPKNSYEKFIVVFPFGLNNKC